MGESCWVGKPLTGNGIVLASAEHTSGQVGTSGHKWAEAVKQCLILCGVHFEGRIWNKYQEPCSSITFGWSSWLRKEMRSSPSNNIYDSFVWHATITYEVDIRSHCRNNFSPRPCICREASSWPLYSNAWAVSKPSWCPSRTCCPPWPPPCPPPPPSRGTSLFMNMSPCRSFRLSSLKAIWLFIVLYIQEAGVPTPKFGLAKSAAEARKIAEDIGTNDLVVKAQVKLALFDLSLTFAFSRFLLEVVEEATLSTIPRAAYNWCTALRRWNFFPFFMAYLF